MATYIYRHLCNRNVPYLLDRILLRCADSYGLCGLKLIQVKQFSQNKLNEYLEAIISSDEGSGMHKNRKASELCVMYRQLPLEDKKHFLLHLAKDYGINHHNLIVLTDQLHSAQSRGPSVLLKTEERIQQALTPQFQNLFTHISRVTHGVKFLVDIRADVLKFLNEKKHATDDVAYLRRMSETLRSLLSLWFSVGFVQLQRITWESPCSIVQKITDYEAVHPMKNWVDVKQRLGPYRRCFVFTHDSMPGEPLVVLHIALTQTISDNIQDIVRNSGAELKYSVDVDDAKTIADLEDPSQIKCAIFYSITITQKGLLGVDLGHYLINVAVHAIQQEYSNVDQLSSLSPIPGYKEWLIGEINRTLNKTGIHQSVDQSFFSLSELNEAAQLLNVPVANILGHLRDELSTNNWMKNKDLMNFLKVPLMRLCARYLYVEKHRGLALNPVANFHLRNGAVLWRLNWLGDLSARGLGNSFGIMVNYRYFMDEMEKNCTAYAKDKTIAVSEQVLSILGH